MTVAGLVVWHGRRLAARLPWRRLLAAGYGTAVAWTLSLALVDGWQRGLAGRLTTGPSISARSPGVTDVPAMLRGFTGRILDFQPDSWTTHVAGHPPGALLVFVGLDRHRARRRRLGGVGCVLVGAVVAVAVPETVRVLRARGPRKRGRRPGCRAVRGAVPRRGVDRRVRRRPVRRGRRRGVMLSARGLTRRAPAAACLGGRCWASALPVLRAGAARTCRAGRRRADATMAAAACCRGAGRRCGRRGVHRCRVLVAGRLPPGGRALLPGHRERPPVRATGSGPTSPRWWPPPARRRRRSCGVRSSAGHPPGPMAVPPGGRHLRSCRLLPCRGLLGSGGHLRSDCFHSQPWSRSSPPTCPG